MHNVTATTEIVVADAMKFAKKSANNSNLNAACSWECDSDTDTDSSTTNWIVKHNCCSNRTKTRSQKRATAAAAMLRHSLRRRTAQTFLSNCALKCSAYSLVTKLNQKIYAGGRQVRREGYWYWYCGSSCYGQFLSAQNKNFSLLLAALFDDIGNRNGQSVYDRSRADQKRWLKLG